MADIQDIYFEPTFGLLVCKIHGSGVHPTEEAIRRHLRGDDHHCRGKSLRQAIETLTSLPLSSLEAMRIAQPAVDTQPITPPLPQLRVLHGWSCMPCAGHFLTTSLELVQRHASTKHGRRRGEQPLWKACKLQTFFSETKDRRYFRVACVPPAVTESNEEETGEDDEIDDLQEVKARRKKVDQREEFAGRTGSCSNPLISNALVKRSVPAAANATNPWRSRTSSRSQRLRVLSSPARPLLSWHPFTPFAAKYVSLPVARLDGLFKSDAFRTASEPLFDTSHADSPLNLHAVFPHSEEDPTFMNALLYSTIQITNRGKSTIEGLSLQGRTFALLKEKLSSPVLTLSPSDVGAIMILKTTAYKTYDLDAHDTHTKGLTKAVEACSRCEDSLTPAAKRATFWLDLFAALLIGSKRCMSHLDLPEKVDWRRERCPEMAQLLPIGFVRHSHALPCELLECVPDIVELQGLLRMRAVAHSPHYAIYHRLENMQASIESRLELQGQSCKQLGVVTEAVRLALFMCCYCSWIEIWNDSLIPCRLAEKLINLLEPTPLFSTRQSDSVWLQHMDILLWLLLTTASVVKMDQGHVEGLKSRQRRLCMSARTSLKDCVVPDLKHLLQSALQDFIYCNGWLTQRCSIKEWSDLEKTINASDE